MVFERKHEPRTCRLERSPQIPRSSLFKFSTSSLDKWTGRITDTIGSTRFNNLVGHAILG